MWLIRTRTGELEQFNGPNDVEGGYAILSHVWQRQEMSFQQLQALQSTTTGVPRDYASPKIRECCVLAESHGYEWLWIDTCCIDRTSSAELSEAINSMFAWYAQAQVCYAYLHDVPSQSIFPSSTSTRFSKWTPQFRDSRWFTRGWTLQELIAPRTVLFYSSDWQMIGTKASMAALLEEITGVDADVLVHRRPVGDVSVARRMWWASGRTTTRVEDEAYSLMGLFGVHMPTVYGEGRRAFRRLQEEILTQTSDQTVFAWGHVVPFGTRLFRERLVFSNYHEESHIFAPSPAAFCNSANFVPIPLHLAASQALKVLGIRASDKVLMSPEEQQSLTAQYLPDFSVTTQGIRSHLFVVSGYKESLTLAIAVLACQEVSSPPFSPHFVPSPIAPLGLLLRRRLHTLEPEYTRFFTGTTIAGEAKWARMRYRLAPVSHATYILADAHPGSLVARWQNVYISHRASSRSPWAMTAYVGSRTGTKTSPGAEEDEVDLGTTARDQEPRTTAFKFVFPRWLHAEFEKHGFALLQRRGLRDAVDSSGKGGSDLPSATWESLPVAPQRISPIRPDPKTRFRDFV
ncbi:HET-domain-containing protein [Epithele typhae]|uniref:HET-domain-containing protein n=1 Tax=Epithele typhae TaxID=378194 RepID=UPI00200896C2|nr:HET-domain-containing protein [Epithele typhae]KAH9909433.1 HET-domain-containing protein [Epithele typhae]